MSTPAIDTIIVFADDVDRLSQFYVNVLGVGDDFVEEEDHVGFNLGDIYLGFDRSDGSHGHPGAVTFWLRVADLDATYEKCLLLGAKPVIEPVERPWGDRLAAVADPEGNVVGFSEERE